MPYFPMKLKKLLENCNKTAIFRKNLISIELKIYWIVIGLYEFSYYNSDSIQNLLFHHPY